MSKQSEIKENLDAALRSFGIWLADTDWRGKEHDCVNVFSQAHLLEHVASGRVLHHPAQVCIECGLPQPAGFANRNSRRDLVIWREPFHNTWSEDRQDRLYDPMALMEWKVKRLSSSPRIIFDKHDADWIARFTAAHPNVVGYVVSTIFFHAGGRSVSWKSCRRGKFSEVETSPATSEIR